jgi:putative oxidoreductase
MNTMSYGLLLLRVVIGGTMFAHGAQKLFGWFGGPGRHRTAGFFGSLGFRAAAAMAILAGLSEAAGALFALGFVTPLAAFAITVVMLIAIATVHWKNGFFSTGGGYEFNLALIAVAVGVAATGPGRFSIDRAIGWDDNISGLWWGLGVLGAALVAAGLTLALGREAPKPADEASASDEPVSRDVEIDHEQPERATTPAA